jgi:hypothetical protein
VNTWLFYTFTQHVGTWNRCFMSTNNLLHGHFTPRLVGKENARSINSWVLFIHSLMWASLFLQPPYIHPWSYTCLKERIGPKPIQEWPTKHEFVMSNESEWNFSSITPLFSSYMPDNGATENNRVMTPKSHPDSLLITNTTLCRMHDTCWSEMSDA